MQNVDTALVELMEAISDHREAHEISAQANALFKATQRPGTSRFPEADEPLDRVSDTALLLRWDSPKEQQPNLESPADNEFTCSSCRLIRHKSHIINPGFRNKRCSDCQP